MIFRLFRRSSNEALIERLYSAVVAASRQPVLYESFGVPDTFEGRFESLTLHAVLALRRLRTCAAPGPEVAQDLVDTVFRHFDRTLREMGVGDTTVPKRMKKLAEAFLGRSSAYEEALGQGADALAVALRRNIVGDANEVGPLATYVAAAAAALEAAPLQAFLDGTPPYPVPTGADDMSDGSKDAAA